MFNEDVLQCRQWGLENSYEKLEIDYHTFFVNQWTDLKKKSNRYIIYQNI